VLTSLLNWPPCAADPDPNVDAFTKHHPTRQGNAADGIKSAQNPDCRKKMPGQYVVASDGAQFVYPAFAKRQGRA